MSTLSSVELGVLGPLHVRQFGLPVAIPGAKPRSILTLLGLNGGAVVPGSTLVELLWGTDPPRTAGKALQTHISALRRALGDGFVLTQGTGWSLNTAEIDAIRYTTAAELGRGAMAAGDASQAAARFDEALRLWRGAPELPDGRRGATERTRWVEGHAALVEDRADALLATGRAAELIGELEAAIADAPLRERRWGHLMLALYRAGRQGEALAAYQRVRALLADELGVDPGPDLRRLESRIVVQDNSLELPVSQHVSSVMRAVTFLLTDIEGSTAAWEGDADAMAEALARHDEIIEQAVTFRGGRLIKTRGEGDATFSVFDRPSGAAAAALELQEAIRREPWALAEPIRIRIALHTGEVEYRDGDYFGRTVNRAARLRSLAAGGQTLCSGATAELVIDSLADDVVLADLGMRQLKNLTRPEHVFELRLECAEDSHLPSAAAPLDRPAVPAVLTGPGPFVGRGSELEGLLAAWQVTLTAGTHAVLIAGEPGVGKTRLAGEWSRQAHCQGAVVVYGRCDEDLGAPYQPFAEALRTLVPCLGTDRLRGLRGVESLLALVPALTEVLPDLAAAPRTAPEAERYALFDAVVALLGFASASAPIVLVLDDLHWAAKPTLLLLRHLLRFGEQARVQIIGTYRSTDLDRAHPLAAMLADLHRDGSATRLTLGGLDESDVTAYVAEAGYDDDELARALASVTGGNPFFLIEALRHVDESGGRWDPDSLPQGVREAVGRRLSRLPAETNKALAAAAVVGSRFGIELVERVIEKDLVDAFDEAGKAGILLEEPGGFYRFNHAIVRQSLLAELASVRRMRLHHKIAVALESEPEGDGELLAELAYHYFECAWAGNADKAVEYCRRAADQAMARLGYEGAADLYDKALHALEELDDEPSDRDGQQAELLVARCEALLAAGDVVSASGAVEQLRSAAGDSVRLAAWGTCFEGQLSMLTDPERLDEIEAAVGAAAVSLAELGDAAGEAKAHTVRAGCLARLGRIGDCETALDHALTAARRAHEHRRVNAVLAGAPLAALWGPNPVPRAGGRCLDVVRLLRITTGSPVVEATSTRCQGVLDALRGRAAAGRQLIDSARRTLNELGMRHAVLEVEQFAGIVELVADDPAAAEQHLRLAYNGFRRMGLDADTAETAALLARACLALDWDAEADELCAESERLAGHAFKAAIAWRTVRAQLLARSGDHDEARRMAEEAVAIAERTDALVDHGDACLVLATVLGAAGDAVGAYAAAERAAGLFELKGAAALVDKAHRLYVGRDVLSVAAPPERVIDEADTECVRRIRLLDAAVDGKDWGTFAGLFASSVSVESRRKLVGFDRLVFSASECAHEIRRICETDAVRRSHEIVAVRGERLALTRMAMGTADESPGAAQDELLELFGLDTTDRLALLVSFDVEDVDTALAEMDTLHAQLEQLQPRRPPDNAASRLDARFNAMFAERHWEEMRSILGDSNHVEDRRAGLRRDVTYDRDTALAEIRAIADLGVQTMTSVVIAIRGERLALTRARYAGGDTRPDAFHTDILHITEIDSVGKCVANVAFDVDDLDAAYEELDARYLTGEASEYAHTWSVIVDTYAAFNQHEHDPSRVEHIDHRRVLRYAPGDLTAANTKVTPNLRSYIECVHRLSESGAVVTCKSYATSDEGFEVEWRLVLLQTVDGDMMVRNELFDEADLDVACATFDQLPGPALKLENAASKVCERLWIHFDAGDWRAVAGLFSEDITNDDRRRVVNAGMERGRDVQLVNLRRLADIGASVSSNVLATRGQLLVLNRVRTSNSDFRHGEFDSEMLNVIETNTDGLITAGVLFDSDDIDAAHEELDARYLAGEGAAHARTWSVITRTFASFNRREWFATDQIFLDHRRGYTPFAPDVLAGSVESVLDLTPDFHLYATSVHRLSDSGAVITQTSYGSSEAGFDAEWHMVQLLAVDGDRVSRCELFDHDHLDAALARLDELGQRVPRMNNIASQVHRRFRACFAARDWQSMTDLVADDICQDDRRRTVNGGIRRGRDAFIEEMQSLVGFGFGLAIMSAEVIAVRGARLVLTRAEANLNDTHSNGFNVEVIDVVEIDADERVVARIVFDSGDLDAAFAELDARYAAGEAAMHANAWSIVTRNVAAFNRHEFPEWTLDSVSVDHRRVTGFAAGDQKKYVRATWEQTPDLKIYIQAVHRLSDLGSVFTYFATGTSHQDFEAEWRGISVSHFNGDFISRSERFDEEDLDSALARFDELGRPTRRLENAASRQHDRFVTYYAAGDLDALAETMADISMADDRRRFVGAGVQPGRSAVVSHARVTSDLGVTRATSSIVATRGQRLVLKRARFWGRDDRPDAFHIEVLHLVEIDDRGQIVAFIGFDLDDLDAAFAELDARYLAGEAAAHADTWSVIVGAFAAFNRRELPATTPNWINIDHRPLVNFPDGGLSASIGEIWNLTPDVSMYIEAVHRLTALGAVVTYAASGTSRQGLDAAWREVSLSTVTGDLINRCEVFDAADLGAALARFDELSCPAMWLENTASRTYERWLAAYALRDWDGMAAVMADDIVHHDRRRVANGGSQEGRTAVIANMHAITDVGVRNMEFSVIATRGDCLVLGRQRVSGGKRPDAFGIDVLIVAEVDVDGRFAFGLACDVDDLDAAFAELDARFGAGEAAAHSRTWSLVASAYAATNRHQIPTGATDVVDHRRLSVVEGDDLIASLRAAWDLTPDGYVYIEAVHRLDRRGAVVTHVARGTGQGGFDARWRSVNVLTVGTGAVERCELFDESDLDAALAIFDEISCPTMRWQNAASRVGERLRAAFAVRDWPAMTELVSDDLYNEDRRRIVNAGIQHGRDSMIEDMRAAADIGIPRLEAIDIATRGERLVLVRAASRHSERPDAFRVENLVIVELGANGRCAAQIMFDPDDLDDAFAELDARYLAGEAAAHAHTWSAIVNANAAFNRREMPATTPDWVNVDHRLGGMAFAPGDQTAYMHATWDVAPLVSNRIVAVHRLDDRGVAFTQFVQASSRDGFNAEWRDVVVLTFDGELINRCEVFDEDDLDTALSRFDELSASPRSPDTVDT